MENQNPLQSENTNSSSAQSVAENAPLLNAITEGVENGPTEQSADQAMSGQTADATAAASTVASASTAMPFIAPVETSNKLKLLQEAILGGNVPQMVLNTISYALELRSSDIHIEPETFTVRI